MRTNLTLHAPLWISTCMTLRPARRWNPMICSRRPCARTAAGALDGAPVALAPAARVAVSARVPVAVLVRVSSVVAIANPGRMGRRLALNPTR
jgi:hypothetical protein